MRREQQRVLSKRRAPLGPEEAVLPGVSRGSVCAGQGHDGLHGCGDRRLPHRGAEREPATGRAGAQALQLLLLAEPHGAEDHGGEGADPRALRARLGAAAAPPAGRDHRQVPGGAARPGPLRGASRGRPRRAPRLLPRPAPQHRPEGGALRRRGHNLAR